MGFVYEGVNPGYELSGIGVWMLVGMLPLPEGNCWGWLGEKGGDVMVSALYNIILLYWFTLLLLF
jgi:hypothetical protein